jgi:hypothetical protein
MDKLNRLYNAVFVVLLIVVIYVFYCAYNRDPPPDMDMDYNGIVTAIEVKEYLKKELDRRSKSPPQFKMVMRSAMSGAFRGALMGLLLNGIEGAATSAIVLGMINPIITSIDHMY